MRWEIFFNEQTATLTTIDAPEGHEFVPPEDIGASIGVLITEPKQGIIISKDNSLFMTWVTQRFSMLGIEKTVERIHHLPML